MKRTLSILSAAALLLVACSSGQGELQMNDNPKIAADVEQALQALPRAEVSSIGVDGVPSFVWGHLWTAVPRPESQDMVQTLQHVGPVFRLDLPNLRQLSQITDRFGFTHIRYAQQFEGLDVVGGDLMLHVDPQGIVYAANGTARGQIEVDPNPEITGADALAVLQADPDEAGLSLGMPKLVVVREGFHGSMHLAYEILAKGLEADGVTPVRDRIYVDAHTGDIVDRHPMVYSARNRKVYSANNGTSLPGTLKRSEGSSASGDASIDGAYDGTGHTYDCYKTLFGRDSYDNNGATLISTVHYDRNYANAYWDGSQMVFGDGDGQQLGPLAEAFDVTAHELTHAVTERTANLNYQDEPGALNEAMSDIMAAVCESWVDGAVSSDTWKVGEDVWTPNTPGDALRYMDDPTADGQSYDYYPERYTGYSDNGGVHLNSGIANLAFYLLSQGGHHPRNKTTTTVAGVGIDKAGQIFYRALTQYMTSSSSFEDARAATAQAATDLYDSATVQSVHDAWTAVGVPGAPSGGGGTTPPPSTGGVLENGVAQTNLSGASGSTVNFTLDVPAGASNLKFVMSGGTGDADLYVRFGAAPTTSTYDYRPYLNGNNETVTASSATAGTWYVMIRGYAAYSGVSLVASFDAGSGGGEPPPPPPPSDTELQNGVAKTNLSAAKNATLNYTLAVPSGASNLKFVMSGGTGDADIYVRFGAAPTTSTYDYRPYLNGNNETVTASSATAGTWYVMIRAYAAFSGVSLVATFDTGSAPPPPTTGNESEPNDSSSTANLISAPGSITGKISSSSDQDIYKLTATGTLTIDMTVPSTKDYDVVLYDSSGTEVTRSENASGQAEHISVNAGSGTFYYIQVFGYNGSYSTTSTYKLTVSW